MTDDQEREVPEYEPSPGERMLQGFVDRMSDKWQKERAESEQMTLGELEDRLEEIDEASALVAGFGKPHSYRGYYQDISFEPTSRARGVDDLLDTIRSDVLGRTFTGYKGGEFLMGENTPVWLASFGTTGRALVALENDGTGVYYPITRDPDPPPAA